MRIKKGSEDAALLSPVPTAKEQHFNDLRLEEDEVERFRRKEEVLLDKVSFHSPSNIGKAYTL